MCARFIAKGLQHFVHVRNTKKQLSQLTTLENFDSQTLLVEEDYATNIKLRSQRNMQRDEMSWLLSSKRFFFIIFLVSVF